MSKVYQNVELTANVLIIIVAILLGGVLIQRYFLTTPAASNQSREQPLIGSQINLSDVNFSAQPKTLILALQKGCKFCTLSAAFYKRLVQDVQNKNIKLVAVLPGNKEESETYLNELGLSSIEVKQSPLANLQASGTPTLILTNEKGEIIHFWVGMLPPEKETEVIRVLNSQSN